MKSIFRFYFFSIVFSLVKYKFVFTLVSHIVIIRSLLMKNDQNYSFLPVKRSLSNILHRSFLRLSVRRHQCPEASLQSLALFSLTFVSISSVCSSSLSASTYDLFDLLSSSLRRNRSLHLFRCFRADLD